MSSFRNVVTRITHYFLDPPKVMGRWTIVYCPAQMKNKVDLSNEDHCGPCGEYRIQKTQEKECVKSHQTIVDIKKQ